MIRYVLPFSPILLPVSYTHLDVYKRQNQPRYTPYHIRHRTEVAGFMSILHGDDRMYNNIFIQNWPAAAAEEKEDMGFKTSDNQEVGTHVFDDYPTYDEWIGWFEMDKPANMMELTPYHFSHLPVWVNEMCIRDRYLSLPHS